MPNFLIVGAPRCGTTLLYYGLQQHPEVFLSRVKEPHFFSSNGQQELSTYTKLFNAVKDEETVGKASTLYLYSSTTPKCIKEYLPDVRIIAVIRNPVERAFSQYLQLRRMNKEPLAEFGLALAAESERMCQEAYSPFYYYRELGFYSSQVERYMSTFHESQIRVFLFEDVKEDPLEAFRSIFDFLGVDQDFIVDTSFQYNPSGVPRSEFLQFIICSPNPLKRALKPFLPEEFQYKLLVRLTRSNLIRPQLDPGLRYKLQIEYEEDILRTGELIKRDLSRWLC